LLLFVGADKCDACVQNDDDKKFDTFGNFIKAVEKKIPALKLPPPDPTSQGLSAILTVSPILQRPEAGNVCIATAGIEKLLPWDFAKKIHEASKTTQLTMQATLVCPAIVLTVYFIGYPSWRKAACRRRQLDFLIHISQLLQWK